MALNAQLEALTVPEGTEFPGTVQALLELIAEYESIEGLSSFSGINTGSTTPDPADQDKPWWKTDESGNPIGWFGWNGSAWVGAPFVMPSGSTAQRPSGADEGQLFFDTDINTTLIYERSEWRTLSGSPGDVKFVKSATLEEALTLNPGWSHDEDSVNRVIAGASNGTGAGEHAYGDEFGAEEFVMTEAQLPIHDVPFQSGVGVFPGAFQNGSQAPGVFPISTGLGDGSTSSTGNVGGDEPISLLQPSIAYWALVKD